MWLERSGYEYQLFPWPAEGFGKLFHLLRSSASPFLKCKSRSRKKPPISKGGHEYGKKATTRVWSPAGAWPRATLTVLATCPIHVYSWSYVMLIPMGLPNSAQGKTLLRSWHQYLFLEGKHLWSSAIPKLCCGLRLSLWWNLGWNSVGAENLDAGPSKHLYKDCQAERQARLGSWNNGWHNTCCPVSSSDWIRIRLLKLSGTLEMGRVDFPYFMDEEAAAPMGPAGIKLNGLLNSSLCSFHSMVSPPHRASPEMKEPE